VLSVPEGVDLRKVDLSIELQILAFHAQRRSAARPGSTAAPGGKPPSDGGAAAVNSARPRRGHEPTDPRPPVSPELAAQA
jgi:redox-sensing transcriptional repressor